MNVCLVLIVSACQMWSVTAVGCGTVYHGVPTFKDCTYRCHCMNDAACDESTGECGNGCDPGWAGPACQYRDAKNGYTAVNHAGGSTTVNDGPRKAVDGDISTCSKSAPQPDQYDYWYIELNRTYLVNGLSITVPVDFLDSFQQFHINLSLDGVNYESQCYRHSGQHVSSTMEFACINITLAKYVKIELGVSNTAIRLCDVIIFSGREIAFNKESAASSLFNNDSTAAMAVNGKTFVHGFSPACFASSKDKPAWWLLDIKRSYLIQDGYYMGRAECCLGDQMRGFQIQVGNASSGPWQTIYEDTYTGNDYSFYTLRAAELQLAYESSSVRLVRERNVAEIFTICEVQIFGECPDGLCGLECTDICHCSTPPTGSHRIHGTCPTGCKERYSGLNGTQRCDIECDASHWGPNCTNMCGNCNITPCDVTTGTCTGGCSGTWKPPLCVQACDAGWHGINCSQTCGHCKDNAVCDKTTGRCPNGDCEDGWMSGMCKTQCMEGSFGRHCSQKCGQCSGNAACFHVDGHCNTSCSPGYTGYTCHKECPDGEYGVNCSQTCGRCSQPCNKVNGICEYGCDPGYNGTLCETTCSRGTYGDRCKHFCGQCANQTACHHENGHCLDGCEASWQQPLCLTDVQHTSDPENLGVPVGAAFAGAAVIIIGIIVAFVIVRRRKGARPKPRKQSRGEKPVHQDANDKQQHNAHVYENFGDLNTASSTTTFNESNECDVIRTELENSVDDRSRNDDYYNEESVATVIPVHKLRELIHKIRQDPLSTHTDFTTLSAGLVFPTTEAMKPANRTKNRYQRMYPYDHTRVKLAIEKGSSETDYINANYINGYHVNKKYIAAQGAMDDTAVDIWRMIWSENAKVIVMLTECFETGKKKCFPYWSNEEPVTFGNYKIQVANTDTFADFVVRTLNCTKLSSQQTRSVTHFQFTSWPDKDVPDSPLSVLQFWNKIRKSEVAPHTPWIVHCSAGIGRTGTFIGLDYLYDQGADQGNINVRGAIETLRQQRTSMIQTKDQYAYLHYIVCEALAPVGEVCKTNDYAGTDQKSSGKRVQQLNKEFGVICEETNVIRESYRDTDMDENRRSGHQTDNVLKSRNLETVPLDLFRPRLSMPVMGCNDFINAVNIPTYRNTKQLIMTQYPLQATILDFMRLIWEQKVNTVVLLEDSIDNDGAYWPLQENTVSFGPFSAELVEHANEKVYTYRRIKYTFSGKKEHREVNHYQFVHWKDKKDTPPDTGSVLQLISDIQSKSMNIPVTVQCMDGATRSGLFAVIWCVLDRMKSDSEVAVVETVRAIRMIRPQTITGVEQYRFVHSLVQDYMDSFDIYVNAV